MERPLTLASNTQRTPMLLTQPSNSTRNSMPTSSHHENTPTTSNSQNSLSNHLTQTIIAEEDPQRSVEIPEDDEDDEATGNGLGEEDSDPDDDDEGDDELNEEVELDDRELAGKATPGHQPLPHWLLEPFKVRVAECSSQYRDAAGLPPLYAYHQTFWFLQPSTYFLVRKGSTPQQIFNPLFFLWDPAALCPNGIPCPNCQQVLHRHQAISRPHQCVGIDQTFWIIGYQYRCRNCVHPKMKKVTVTF